MIVILLIAEGGAILMMCALLLIGAALFKGIAVVHLICNWLFCGFIVANCGYLLFLIFIFGGWFTL